MFQKQNVYAVVQSFGVRVKDERQQDRNHLMEVGFEVSLTYDMADQILPAMARDLYLSVKGDMQPRPEMTEAVFALTPPEQVMECREHPDLQPEVRVEGVSLKKIKAVKGSGGSWALRFTATWTLGRSEEVALMIRRLKLGVYLSFQEMQPALPVQPIDADAVETDAVARDEPKDGKKKRRGRKNPEGEAQAQIAEGRKLLEAGDRFGKDADADDAATAPAADAEAGADAAQAADDAPPADDAAPVTALDEAAAADDSDEPIEEGPL